MKRYLIYLWCFASVQNLYLESSSITEKLDYVVAESLKGAHIPPNPLYVEYLEALKSHPELFEIVRIRLSKETNESKEMRLLGLLLYVDESDRVEAIEIYRDYYRKFSNEPEYQKFIIQRLGKIAGKSEIVFLKTVIMESDFEVKVNALHALAQIPEARENEHLHDLVEITRKLEFSKDAQRKHFIKEVDELFDKEVEFSP